MGVFRVLLELVAVAPDAVGSHVAELLPGIQAALQVRPGGEKGAGCPGEGRLMGGNRPALATEVADQPSCPATWQRCVAHSFKPHACS